MKKRGNFSICIRLIGLVKPLTGFMLLAITMGVVGHLCATLIPILGGVAFLKLLGFVVPIPMIALFACLFSFAILRGVLHYGEQACNHYIAFKLLAILREKVFTSLRKLCPAKLEGKDKGNLIAVITSDIELLEVFYAHTISPIVIALVMSAVMTLFIGSFHWTLGVIAVVAYLVVGVVIPLLTSNRSGDSGRQFRAQSGNLSSYMLDSLRGLSEVLQYGVGEQRLAEISHQTDELAKNEEILKLRGGQSTAATNTIILLFDMVLLLTASHLYVTGSIGFGGVLITVFSFMSSFGPVIALANLGSGLQNTFGAGNGVLDILDEEPVVEEIFNMPTCTFDGAEIDNITFSYDGDIILDDVSMTVPKQTVIGVTGRSGSGKSTLLKLLMRFWLAQKGKIIFSEQEINEINTADLRAMQSYVTQETHLFHDSIANNLRIAKLNATQSEIEQACKKASIHEFIANLPSGYETTVSELGDSLSGGERQPLGLARAFLHDAPLLLLDEPTSNLDSLNEAVILSSIGEECGDKTVVLVSHRRSTMRLADVVYSVEHGRTS